MPLPSLAGDKDAREHGKFLPHGGVSTDAPILKIRMDKDGSGRLLYVGMAIPGSATSEAVWQIQKQLYDGAGFQTGRDFADSGKFTQIWDNRASLTYA